MVTVLNTLISYEKGAELAKKAYAQNCKLKDVALEDTELSEEGLSTLLAPAPWPKVVSKVRAAMGVILHQ